MPSKSPLSTKANDFLNQIDQLKETIAVGGDLSNRLLRGCYKRVLSDLEGLIRVESEPVKLASQLKGYLSAHWDLIKGTSLSYTALPEDGLTGLLVDIASFVAETIKTSDDEPLYPLTVLMPTVAVESLVDDKDYPSLNELALPEILRTHVLGREGSYLVPVRKLIDLQEKPKSEWHNLYYDYKAHSKAMALLSPEDYEQLSNHSLYTKALIEAKAQYELSLKEQGSLLYHLRELSSKLYFNSVDAIGQEKNAGSGTYDAIIQFNDYYTKLDEEAQKKIPSEVKKEIDLLLSLSSDSTKNINATENIETCIATRRKLLVHAMGPVEQVLSEIGLTEETAKTLTAEKKAQFISCQNELKKAIEEKKYQGIDKRGLTLELVKTLNVDIAISSAADLQEIVKLSHSELDSLFKEASLQKQFVGQFESLEGLVLFIHQTPIPKLQVFLNHCGQSLANKFILKPRDLIALLISLDSERLPLLSIAMADKIKTSDDFIALINNLSPEQFLVVCNALKEKLFKIIKTASDFKALLGSLSLEQGSVIFELMKDKIPELIKTAGDFQGVIGVLRNEQHIFIYEAMKHKLPSFINTANDFRSVVNYLYAEQGSFVFEAVKDRLPKLITNALDFHKVLENLPYPEQRTFVFEAMSHVLPDFIETFYDFNDVIEFVSSGQRTLVLASVKEKISRFIDKDYDFNAALTHLSAEQSLIVLDAVKNKIPQLITEPKNFRIFLQNMPCEVRAVIFENIKNRAAGIIETAENLGATFASLTLEESAVVLESVKHKIPQLIKNATDVKASLRRLPPDARIFVFLAIKDRVSNIIETANDLKLGLECLYPGHCLVLMDSIKEKLPEIIQTIENYVDIIGPLDGLQRAAIFTAMKDRLPDLIKTPYDFKLLLEFLSKDQRALFFEAVKERLPQFIDSPYNFREVLRFAPLEKRDLVFDAMKNRFSELIKTAYDFKLTLELLSSEQCTALCNEMEGKLAYFAQDADQLCEIIKRLSEQKAVTFLANFPYFHRLIVNVKQDFPKIDKLFGAPDSKKQFHQAYFNSLLVDIKACRSSQNKALDRLCETLGYQAKAYFSGQTDIDAFKEACQSTIEEVRCHLRGQETVLNLIGKWMLAIFTLGAAVAYSSLRTTQTGEWTCNFFKVPGEVEAEKMQEIVAKGFNP
ncbi:hypothetical protein [Legionella feeleii]|uniref:Uncharacterized protein n=1 Tax=Legionella feeleii TaxID=453 RepID=A0A378KK20_9GAMM|nr:hypothetical protein [Legionella feeleii]STX88246.1 Uncharacterised protein [Legionella feeleii]